MKGEQLMSFSEIKGNDLEIPQIFMEEVFSRSKRVVIKENQERNGIIVEVIDPESVKALVKSIRKLYKKG